SSAKEHECRQIKKRRGRLGYPKPTPFIYYRDLILYFRLLAGTFAHRRVAVFASLAFAVAFSDLLFNFFGDLIDGGIEIAFGVLREKVRAAHSQPHGALELAFGN